jgi:hypothetical protein
MNPIAKVGMVWAALFFVVTIVLTKADERTATNALLLAILGPIIAIMLIIGGAR